MDEIIIPGVKVTAFLRRAKQDGYSMQKPFIDPEIAKDISAELQHYDYLHEIVELQDTRIFERLGMYATQSLHATLNDAICEIEGKEMDYLTDFSVRVFQPSEYGTTIHRNDPAIGAWAVGITLNGEAPFCVYDQDVLPDAQDQTRELLGKGVDPYPRESMLASAGSAWTLYTANELVPHSGGLVNSDVQRELLILYGVLDD